MWQTPYHSGQTLGPQVVDTHGEGPRDPWSLSRTTEVATRFLASAGDSFCRAKRVESPGAASFVTSRSRACTAPTPVSEPCCLRAARLWIAVAR